VDERVRTNVRTERGGRSGSIPGVCTPSRTSLVSKLLDAIAESDAVAPPTHGHKYDQSSAVVRIQTLSRVAARYEKDGEQERAHFVLYHGSRDFILQTFLDGQTKMPRVNLGAYLAEGCEVGLCKP
jgi:hypothetical protein